MYFEQMSFLVYSLYALFLNFFILFEWKRKRVRGVTPQVSTVAGLGWSEAEVGGRNPVA